MSDDHPDEKHCGRPTCNYGHYWLDGPERQPGEREGRGPMYRCNGKASLPTSSLEEPTLCAVRVEAPGDLPEHCEEPSVMTVKGRVHTGDVEQEVKAGVCATHKPFIVGPYPTSWSIV